MMIQTPTKQASLNFEPNASTNPSALIEVQDQARFKLQKIPWLALEIYDHSQGFFVHVFTTFFFVNNMCEHVIHMLTY